MKTIFKFLSSDLFLYLVILLISVHTSIVGAKLKNDLKVTNEKIEELKNTIKEKDEKIDELISKDSEVEKEVVELKKDYETLKVEYLQEIKPVEYDPDNLR